MKLMRSKLLWAAALSVVVMTSCKKEAVFDQNNYDNLVKSSFPVQNVDPQHDWATVGTATAEVSINLDYGVTYDVGLYLDNPIGATQATRVYEKKLKSGESFSTTFSYKLASPVVYVGIFDPQGRGFAQVGKIENGRVVVDINTNVTSSVRQRASEDASVYSQYVKTYNDYLNPVVSGATTNQITIAEMQAYPTFTDTDLASNSTLTNGSWKWSQERGSYQEFIGGGDGKHFRVASGTTINSVFHVNGTYGVYNDVVIYIEGTVHLNGNTLNGPTLVVANGGEIVIDGNTHMSNAGRIVVLAGGKITSTQNVYFNVNNGSPCYNAGTIQMTSGELNVNGSDFYNSADGTVRVNSLRNTSGGKFTNFGTIEAVTNTGSGDAYNCEIINGCHMKFTGDAGVGGITMLDNSRLDIAGQLLITGRVANGQGRNNTLYKNSVINAGSIKFRSATFVGPTATGEFAIVKTSKELVDEANTVNSYNNVYWDINRAEFYDYNNNLLDITNIYGAAWHILNNGDWCTSGMTHFVSESTATNDFSISAGKCTGAGYNPDGNPGGGKPGTTTLSFRFMFEDNYPDTGDYDLNDCVFTVTPVIDANNAKKVTVTVAAEACGASKTIGAAIRLVGVSRGLLSTDPLCTQAFSNPPGNVGEYHNIPDGQFATSQDPTDQSSLVMLLCKDMHYALNPQLSGTGIIERLFYNTPMPGWTNYGQANVRTATYVFEFNNETDAQKMLDQATYDAFIVEEYNGSYWEVHTVQNDRKGALVLHYGIHAATYQDYLNAYVRGASGNIPWAVMVPSTVEYPLEGRQITTAYPNFTGWAQNHTENTDWYDHPASGNTFPLSLIYK